MSYVYWEIWIKWIWLSSLYLRIRSSMLYLSKESAEDILGQHRTLWAVPRQEPSCVVCPGTSKAAVHWSQELSAERGKDSKSALHHSTHILLHCIPLHHITSYYIMLYYIILYYYIILHYTILYMLHYTCESIAAPTTPWDLQQTWELLKQKSSRLAMMRKWGGWARPRRRSETLLIKILSIHNTIKENITYYYRIEYNRIE